MKSRQQTPPKSEIICIQNLGTKLVWGIICYFWNKWCEQGLRTYCSNIYCDQNPHHSVLTEKIKDNLSFRYVIRPIDGLSGQSHLFGVFYKRQFFWCIFILLTNISRILSSDKHTEGTQTPQLLQGQTYRGGCNPSICWKLLKRKCLSDWIFPLSCKGKFFA